MLIVPDIFIGGCGTQMYSFDDDGNAIVDDKWMAQLGHGWDKEAVQRVVENSTDLAELFGPISQVRLFLSFSLSLSLSLFSLSLSLSLQPPPPFSIALFRKAASDFSEINVLMTSFRTTAA
jgi:hypothetical protein